MKRSRFTEDQIFKILKEADGSDSVKEVYRRHGISPGTYYQWKSKYGGLQPSDLKKMKELERENAKLKQMYAETALENKALKDLLDRKTLTPSEKREAIAFLVAEHDLSVRRAFAAVKFSRAAFYRGPGRDPSRDEPVIDALNATVSRYPTWGFWKCYHRLRLDGQLWNHKRVLRVYREMRLNLPRRTKKRVPLRERQTLEVPEAPNAIWAFDFMSDTLYRGRRFRTLNILDEGVREALDIVIDTSIPGGRVARTLEQLSRWRGLPQAIRCDNGPEMLSQPFVDWCEENQVEIRYIQPGKPNQNAHIERLNRTYRQEVLNAHLFRSLNEVRELTYR